MYQICLPHSTAPEFLACGNDGEVPLAQSNQEVVLIYIHKGMAQITYHLLTQTATAGDLVTVVEDSSITFSQDALYDWLSFSQEGLHLLPHLNEYRFNKDDFILGSQFACLCCTHLRFLFRYLTETQKDSVFAELKYAYIVKLIICEATQQYQNCGKDKNNQKLSEILNWIQNHYAEPVSLGDLGARFYYNKVYLCRLFKNKTGESIYNFVTRLRIERSMVLLLNTSDTINDIARQVGYSDEKQYMRNFRIQSSVTPTQFRNQNIKMLAAKGEEAVCGR